MKLDTSSYYPESPLDHLDESTETEEKQEIQSVGSEDHVPYVAETEGHSSGAPEPDEHVPDLPETAGEAFVTRCSNILSWVLVPLMMPVYGVMLAFGLSLLQYTSFGTRLAFTLIVAAFNVAVPSTVMLMLKKFGVITDVGLNKRTERPIPFLVCIICLVGTALFMTFKGAPQWLVLFFYGGAVAGVIEAVVNNWWKISVHAAGAAGLVALLLRMLVGGYADSSVLTWLIIGVGVAGLLGSARIWLGRHTAAQVIAGYAVGFCSIYFMMLI